MIEHRILGVMNGRGDDEVIEIVSCGDGPEDCIQLRNRRWGSGIGWYTQKSVDIPASQIGRLIHALEKVKRPASRQASESRDSRGVILPFRSFGT